jgi:PBS lyase HEAT-like repeat
LRAVARIGRREDLDFLNRVLHHGSDQDRMYAALGLGKIGGDPAVRALVDADEHQPEIVRWVITNALGNTKSALAVDALIKRVGKSSLPLELTCDALMDLTRHRWCADPPWDDDENVLRRRWTRWWKANRRNVRLSSAADGCPNFPELLPQVR